MVHAIPILIKVDIDGLKIYGVRTYKVNIFDAWKDKGVILKQPLANYNPPKDIDMIIKMGIAQALQKKEEEVKSKVQSTDTSLTLQELINNLQSQNYHGSDVFSAINSLKVSSYGTITVPTPEELTSGGAMFDLGDIGKTLGDIGKSITSGFNKITSSVSQTLQDIGKIWNALLRLSDLINAMYAFMRQWRESNNLINQRLINLTTTNQALVEAANKLILENREIYAKISEMMNETLAKYFDDLVYNLIRYGQVDVPTAVVGAVELKVNNDSPLPATVTIPNLKIMIGPYVVHEGAYTINMFPFEKDVGDILFDLNGVEEAKYVLDAKKNNMPLVITVTGTMLTPFGKKDLNISKRMSM